MDRSSSIHNLNENYSFTPIPYFHRPLEAQIKGHSIEVKRTGVVRFMAVRRAFVVTVCVLYFGVFVVALVAGFVHRPLADRGVSAHGWFSFGGEC